LVSVDVTGPFPGTDRKNVYVVVFTDHLTRWVEAFATADMTTPTIADLLIKHIICRHGSPRTLLSDQGSSFVSHLAAAVYHRLGVAKIQASTYHPQTNGLVERFNRTMKEMLQKYVDTRHTDWDTYVPYVVFAYNTSAHKALDGLTPFQMLYGRKPTLPVDAMLLPAETQRVLTASEQTYYADLQHGLQLLHSHGRYSLQRQQRERIWRRRAQGNVPSFNVGDVVWIKEGAAEVTPEDDTGLARKLMPKWKGPFIVTRVVGPLNYVVQGPGGYEKLVHVERVKMHRQDAGRPPPEDAAEESSETESDASEINDDGDEKTQGTEPVQGLSKQRGEDKADDSSEDEADGGVAIEWEDTAAVNSEEDCPTSPYVEAKGEEPDGMEARVEGPPRLQRQRPVGRTAMRGGKTRRSGRRKRKPARAGQGETKAQERATGQTRTTLGPVDRRQMTQDRARTAVRRRNQCGVCGQLKAGHTCTGKYVPQPQSTGRYARHAASPSAGPDPSRICFGIRRRDGSATVVFKGPGKVTKAVDGHHLDKPREGEDNHWHDTCCMCAQGGAVVCCYSCNEVAHPGCLQRQDVATFEDDEDYLCAQCALTAWESVLKARGAEPGVRALADSPFSSDRPMATVNYNNLAVVPWREDSDSGARGRTVERAGAVKAPGNLIGGRGVGRGPTVNQILRAMVVLLLLQEFVRRYRRQG
jgi:hypothetical protein